MIPREIIKSAGEKQEFSKQKLLESLHRAQIDEKTAREIVEDIVRMPNIKSTDDLHYTILRKLKDRKIVYAAKYNLRRAITQLGPSGYPFEQFIARLLKEKGYSVKTNQILQGKCITHEIDVLGFKDKKHYIFECKFHNKTGFKSSIQTVLYMKSRYEDILAKWRQVEGNNKHLHKVWIVTNTKFTSDAKNYAKCIGMGLISWRYPSGSGLVDLIEETGLHPVTAIVSLTKKQKRYIINNGLVVCREVETKKDVLEKIGVKGKKLKQIIKEANEICGC